MYLYSIAVNGDFWIMIGALVSAGATVAAVWNAVIARRAVRASLEGVAAAREGATAAREIDQNYAARARDREHRDAVPLATAIQQEIQAIILFGYKVIKMINDIPNHEIVCREVVKQRKELLPQTLIDHIGDLGCLDAATGKNVAGALTFARNLHNALEVDDDFVKTSYKKILLAFTDLSMRTRSVLHFADEGLAQVTNIPSLKRDVPPPEFAV